MIDPPTQKDTTWPSPSDASLQHLIQDTLQRIILQRSRNALFVSELLVDLIILAVTVLLAAHDHAVVRWQGLLETDAYAQAYDGGERAVGNGGRDLDQYSDDGVGGWNDAGPRGRRDVDVLEVDD